MQKHRKLAAIMFTDIAGYTALMSKDEENALCILQKNRDTIKILVSQFSGEWLKEMGDGTLSSFGSVVDAVNCALEIQSSLKDETDFKLRIGIHIGDVVVEEGDVFGDGVNVASRIEKLAEPGGICVSGRVYDDIQNKPMIEASYLGEKMLKNVSNPVKIYALFRGDTPPSMSRPSDVQKSPTTKIRPSIAVLPFMDMSADPEQEYFCDGISEDIITDLAHVEGLLVMARNSTFAFKGQHPDIREVGRKLNVETVLEGSVRKTGNRLRITAQLINVADGYHIWAERYDREMEDIFDIQDEISLAIVDNLKVKLLGKEKAAIVKRYTEDLEAYNLYLMGNHYCWQLGTQEGIDKGIECFIQAIKKDPGFALAYTGLAMNYVFCSYWGKVPPNEGYPMAEQYAMKALEIDDTLAEAHEVLGIVYYNYTWNWNAAEREWKQSLQLNPNSAWAHTCYSELLIFTDRTEEAIYMAKRAQELDPLSSFINTNVGIVLVYAAQWEKAIEELQMTLSIHPNYFLAHLFLGYAYQGKSMLEEAIAEHEIAVKHSGSAPLTVAALAAVYYMADMKAKTEELLDRLKERSKNEYILPICFYWIYRVLGDMDKAFEWVERACNEHDSFLPWLRFMPIEEYRIPDEPRFNALLIKYGIGVKKG